MSDPIPPTLEPPPGPPEPKSKGPLIIGFASGAVCWLSTLAFNGKSYDVILPLVFNCFVLPVLAVILAIIRPTRRFGLGLLLASGLGWLVLGAICGGLIGKR